jgi:hypothetical protein
MYTLLLLYIIILLLLYMYIYIHIIILRLYITRIDITSDALKMYFVQYLHQQVTTRICVCLFIHKLLVA